MDQQMDSLITHPASEHSNIGKSNESNLTCPIENLPNSHEYSLKNPTLSPPDLRPFSNHMMISNPTSEVGVSILNTTLTNETQTFEEAIDSLNNKRTEQFDHKALPFLSDTSSGISSSLTGLNQSLNPSFKTSLENQNTDQMSSSPPVIGGGSNLDNSSSVTPISLLPVTINGASDGISGGSLTANEIKLSEEYTRVTSHHGPNPKITHIFGDSILKCHPNKLMTNIGDEKKEQASESHQVANRLGSSTPILRNDFLGICYSCKKKLEEGKDIYMYRGDTSFCSEECRFEEILADNTWRKNGKKSSNTTRISSNRKVIFLVD